jgi:hypothetical protein
MRIGYFALLGQVFWRVQVAESFWGKAGGFQLLFSDRLRAGSFEELINFAAALAEGLLCGVGELRAIDGA